MRVALLSIATDSVPAAMPAGPSLGQSIPGVDQGWSVIEKGGTGMAIAAGVVFLIVMLVKFAIIPIVERIVTIAASNAAAAESQKEAAKANESTARSNLQCTEIVKEITTNLGEQLGTVHKQIRILAAATGETGEDEDEARGRRRTG